MQQNFCVNFKLRTQVFQTNCNQSFTLLMFFSYLIELRGSVSTIKLRTITISRKYRKAIVVVLLGGWEPWYSGYGKKLIDIQEIMSSDPSTGDWMDTITLICRKNNIVCYKVRK